MLTVGQLTAFDPARLAADAEAWRQVADEFAEHGEALRTEVDGRLAPPGWDGAAAWAARARVGTLRTSCDAEQRQWARTAGMLGTAAASLTEARGRLVAACQVAAAHGLRVSDDGVVAPAPAAWTRATPAQRGVLQAMSAHLTGDIRGILALATDVDDRTALALADTEVAQDPGSGTRGFGGPEADAAAAVELVSDGLTIDELPVLLQILQENEGDPAFASAFWSGVGPTRGLMLVHELAGFDWTAEAAQAQTLLGPTLALVTDRDSPGYLGDAWVGDLLRTDRPYPDYAALGVLLTSADWSTEFLVQVGETFTTVEDGNAENWYYVAPHQLDLDDPYGDGNDPFESYLETLGRHPDAAEQFFDPAQHPGRLEYHLTERDTLPTIGGPEGTIEYADRLGTALEAAVGDDPHSAVSAHIMSETVYLLGSPDKLNGDVPPTMRDSVGRMVAEYIGDVNAHLSNDHVDSPYHLGTDADGNPVFATGFDDDIPYPDGVMAPGTGDEAHAIFDESDLLRTMAGAAEDEDGYVAMYEAQAAYATIVLDATATDPNLDQQQRADQVRYETDQLAKVFGAIDQARAVSVEDLYTQADADHNGNIALAEQGAGKIAGFLANELLESVPGDDIIKMGVDPLVKWLFGSQDSTDAMTRAIADVYHGGRDQAFEVARAVLQANGLWNDSWWGLTDAAGDGYTDGRAAMDEALGRT
ncbi:MAG TPA: hypothetical protein VGD67_13975 [Pseudonocardiaceae bacterium]